jgi:hypothetical protein
MRLVDPVNLATLAINRVGALIFFFSNNQPGARAASEATGKQDASLGLPDRSAYQIFSIGINTLG